MWQSKQPWSRFPLHSPPWPSWPPSISGWRPTWWDLMAWRSLIWIRQSELLSNSQLLKTKKSGLNYILYLSTSRCLSSHSSEDQGKSIYFHLFLATYQLTATAWAITMERKGRMKLFRPAPLQETSPSPCKGFEGGLGTSGEMQSDTMSQKSAPNYEFGGSGKFGSVIW